MVIKITKKASRSQIQLELKKIGKKKAKGGFDAKKYYGKLVRGLEGLVYQKAVRNEWN
ncbi:MAG TPA: hypothetical protein VFU05_00725 [Cyclobacteriaceae bacterium]|nr:hypothetical protein [Cyclobacteriaceae bacterium]